MSARARSAWVGAVVASVVAAGTLSAAPAVATGTRRTGRIHVVVAFFPLAEAVRQVGGPLVQVEDLTPGGAEPHDLELTTDSRDAIDGARLVVVLGGGFQPAVEDAAGQRDGPTLVVSHALSRADRRRQASDPHIWLDPVLMRRIVDKVMRALVRADRRHVAGYRRRAAAYEAQLAALDGEYRTGLSACARQVIVTAHRAFGWLARRYGLRQEGITGIDPEAEPDPKRLGELADLVKRTGTTTVFTEELVSPKVAQTLAREAGVHTEVLSPLEGLGPSERAAHATYLSLMRDNLHKLRAALACR